MTTCGACSVPICADQLTQGNEDIGRLHTCGGFANLCRASRVIRKDPATEQETVPGAADNLAPRCAEAFWASETAESPLFTFATCR